MAEPGPRTEDTDGAAGPPGRRRPLVLAIAGLAVVAVAGGAYALTRGSDTPPAVGTGVPIPLVRRDPALPADALANITVRDGDRVRAIGSLEARPGKPVFFCGTKLLGVHSSPQNGGAYQPDCEDVMSVPVIGVDLDRLHGVVTAGRNRMVNVRLTAVWHEGRSMTVTAVTVTSAEEPAVIPALLPSRTHYTKAQQHAADQGVQALEGRSPALGLNMSGTSSESTRLQVGGLVVDSRVYGQIAPLDRPAGILSFTAAIVPLN